MDLLDQSDIDALLAAAEDDGDEASPQAEARLFSRNYADADDVEIRSYDFKRPERVSKDQMRALQTLHEAFARNFGASLSGFLRTIVEVRLATCEQMTYGEFIGGLPNPTSFNLIDPTGLDGQLCLEISPLIIYPIIDRLLGGNSEDLFIPQRPMTQIETRLISNVTSRGLAALAEAWHGIRELTFEVAATESNPQLVQIVPPNEVVVVVGLEIKMSNRAGTMNLCVPYNAIEPVMDQLASQNWFSASRRSADDGHARMVQAGLGQAKVEVRGLLSETTATLSEIQSLAVGDLILTHTPADAPVQVLVEGERTFIASLGQHDGVRAVRVIRAMNPAAGGPSDPDGGVGPAREPGSSIGATAGAAARTAEGPTGGATDTDETPPL